MKTKVNYVVTPRMNPQEKSAPPRWYGQIVGNRSVGIDELAGIIAGRCTVKPADVVGVVTAFETEMKKALLNSEIVELDRIGRFRVTVNGKGALTEEDHTAGHIKGVKVRFAPAKYIKEVLSKADFSTKPLSIREAVAGNEEDEEVV